MGGTGSGRKNGKQPKKTTERVPSLDIRQLNREGYLKPHTDGTFTWSVGGKKIASIEYRVHIGSLVLRYNRRSADGNWLPTKQTVTFDQTACNYGNKRHWFLCSNCGRRVAILYYMYKGFYCRHCHDLSYECQQENKMYRMMRKARKIRQKLGVSEDLFEPIYTKPKNMHHSTFDKLRQEAEYFHTLSWSITEERFEKSL